MAPIICPQQIDYRMSGRQQSLGWAAVGFSIVASHSIYLGALPYHLVKANVSGFELGVILAGFAAGTLTTRFFLLFRWLKKVPMSNLILVGLALLLLSQLGYFVIEYPDLFSALRFINGMANATLFYCLFSMLPEDNKEASKLIGMLGGGAGCALIAGAPTGFFIGTEFGLKSVVILGTLCALAAALAIHSLADREKMALRGSQESVRPNRGQIVFCLSLVLIAYALGSLETLLPLLSAELSRTITILSFIGFGIGFVGGRIFGGKYSLEPKGTVIARTMLVAAAIAALFAGTTSLDVVILAAAMVLGGALGFGNTWASSNLTLSASVSSRGSLALTGQIVSDAGVGLGAFTAPIIFGSGKILVFSAIACCCCLAMVSMFKQAR